jgi:hypothetical protein
MCGAPSAAASALANVVLPDPEFPTTATRSIGQRSCSVGRTKISLTTTRRGWVTA